MKDFPQLNGFKGSPSLIRLIGHRGARGLMPENTIEGFEFTLDLGVTALEFDVLVHSDITYDVVPVIDGAFFRFDEYLTRFLSSMENLHLDPGMSKRDIKAALHQMVGKSSLRDSYVAMVCSRGKPKIAGSRDPRDCDNHFFAWCVPYVHIIKPETVEQGATAWISQNAYRIPENSVNPRTKNYHWGDFTQGIFEAKDKNYETVILLDYDGNVTEGPGFNVFAVKDKVLITPDRGVLAGVSRKTVLEMAEHLQTSLWFRMANISLMHQN